MTNFWQELPKPFFILAPMEDVTDVVFRHVVAQAGPPDVYMTEFTNSASYCSPKGQHSTRGRLTFTDDEQPIVAQIWGNNPEYFEIMSKGLAKQGFAGIDINMGCPDKSVVKQGSGSGLILNPELTSQLIASAKKGGLPVSVKTRLGYSRLDELRPWIKHLLEQDIVNLTIHLRTKKEMSKVEAHFELIPEIMKLRDEIAPQTLITINGDIRDRAHGEELVAKYGVDGIMIGRGIFKNPFAFASETFVPFSDQPVDSSTDDSSRTPQALLSEPADHLSKVGEVQQKRHLQPEFVEAPGPSPKPGVKPSCESNGDIPIGSKKNLLELLNIHLDLHDKHSTELEPRKFDPLKRFFKIYIRDFPGASELRDKLMHSKNTEEVREILATAMSAKASDL